MDHRLCGANHPTRKKIRERYIITMTEYLTRWEEETPVLECTADIVA